MAEKIRKSSQLADVMALKNAHKNVIIKRFSWMSISISGADADLNKLDCPDGYYVDDRGRITNRGNTKGSIFQVYDVIIL